MRNDSLLGASGRPHKESGTRGPVSDGERVVGTGKAAEALAAAARGIVKESHG